MKILYIDNSITGHHLVYLSSLVNGIDCESVLVLPESVELNCRQYVYKTHESAKRDLQTFKKWVREIYEIAKIEKPDIVHFLYGDVFYRFFGSGLNLFKKYRTILTMHWAKDSFWGRLSTKIISSKVDYMVVHSKYIQNLFVQSGIQNACHIEYPQFNTFFIDSHDARKYYELVDDIPVIACIGGTRKDKGIDILLEALNKVEHPFQLLIAGKEEFFDKNFIVDHIKNYEEKVSLHLHYLSDLDIANAFCASDIIALPYRKNFNGASGPLGEGVALEKCIIGPSHGTLGFTINEYNLGYTFESENVLELSSVIETALSSDFSSNNKYREYRDSLSPRWFVSSYKRLYVALSEIKNKHK